METKNETTERHLAPWAHLYQTPLLAFDLQAVGVYIVCHLGSGNIKAGGVIVESIVWGRCNDLTVPLSTGFCGLNNVCSFFHLVIQIFMLFCSFNYLDLFSKYCFTPAFVVSDCISISLLPSCYILSSAFSTLFFSCTHTHLSSFSLLHAQVHFQARLHFLTNNLTPPIVIINLS